MRVNANAHQSLLKRFETIIREHTNPNVEKMRDGCFQNLNINRAEKVRNGSADPEKARTLDAATGAELAIALKGAGGNPANLGAAMRGYGQLTGVPTKEALIKARAACALHCQKDGDRKSTRLNSSHQIISYAVFCLKNKNTIHNLTIQFHPNFSLSS